MSLFSGIVNVVLMDDHLMFREGLRRVLQEDEHIRVVGEASTVAEALELCRSGGPTFDIALVDYQLEASGTSATGVDVLEHLRMERPEAAVIMLTGGLPPGVLAQVVKQHRAGVFLKSEPVSELLGAIEKVLRGDIAISSKAAGELLQFVDAGHPAASPPVFGERELLVLRLITEGLGNKEIALRLDTTETNVKAILQRLFKKTGVRSRSQLVRYVFEFNLEIL